MTTYADVTVVCAKIEVGDDDPHGVLNPRLIAELASCGEPIRFDVDAIYRIRSPGKVPQRPSGSRAQLASASWI